jgi:hypothetical protein
MKILLAQMILAAKNDDFEGWMQILLVVIMAVVYGLSGILKSVKSKKLEDEKDRKKRQGEQPRPARTVIRRVYQVLSQPPSQEAVQSEPVPLKPTPSGQAVPTIPEEPQLAIQTPQLEAEIQEVSEITPGIEKLPEFTGEMAKALEPKRLRKHKRPRTAVPMEIAEAAYLGKPLLDVNDPGAIRRAILHYEVLGKPLSLRDSGE